MLSKMETKKSKRGDMKRQIVSIALDLFSSLGYDSVSTTVIASHAGVSQPNIHYYFKTKEDLWKAAVEELAERIQHASRATVSEQIIAGLDPLSGLKLLCAALHVVSREVPELGKMIHLEGQAGGKRLEWLMERVILPGNELYIELIEQGIEQGLIKPYKPHQIMMMIHGAAVSYYNLAPLMKAGYAADPFDRETGQEFADLCVDTLFAGLQA